jgi:hypothetical protein
MAEFHTLRSLALEKVIACCSSRPVDPKLGDVGLLPKVFHGVIWKGVHQRRFSAVLEELDLYFDQTLKGRFLAARCNGDMAYCPLDDLDDWLDENAWTRRGWTEPRLDDREIPYAYLWDRMRPALLWRSI